MKTFLFYDVETTGLNPAFDQILTFACIRTDLSLNEISRDTITIKLRRDIVPSPMAFLTHGLTMDELNNGITEYQAAKKIHKLVNTPGTISLGYNSLGFDDEFLRFLFYRNLLDPYIHQYSNGCSRMDILPITTVYRVFAGDDVLHWPQLDEKSSLKLDLISQANQFVTSGRAHEAMNDVEALVELTKRLCTRKDIWNYCFDFFNKKRDEVRIQGFNETIDIHGREFLKGILVSASFGPQVNYIAPAINIGFSIPYQNQSLWIRLDSEDILGMDEDCAFEDTFVIRKRFGDIPIVLPALDRFKSKMASTEREKMTENIEKIGKNSDRFFSFIHYHQDFKYPYIPEMDIDAGLYQEGFFTKPEKKQIHAFHRAFEQGDVTVFKQIESPRIKLIAQRIIARNAGFPDSFENDPETILRIDALRNAAKENKIIGYKNDTKLACEDALSELDKLEQDVSDPDSDQGQMLSWLRQYIDNL